MPVYTKNNKVVMSTWDGSQVGRRCWCCDPRTATPTGGLWCGHTNGLFTGGPLCVTPDAELESDCLPPGSYCDDITDDHHPYYEAFSDVPFTSPGCVLNVFAPWEVKCFLRLFNIGGSSGFADLKLWDATNVKIELSVFGSGPFIGLHKIRAEVFGACWDTGPINHMSFVYVNFYPEFSEDPFKFDTCVAFTVLWDPTTKVVSFGSATLGGANISELDGYVLGSGIMPDEHPYPCCPDPPGSPGTKVMNITAPTPTQTWTQWAPVVICYGPPS